MGWKADFLRKLFEIHTDIHKIDVVSDDTREKVKGLDLSILTVQQRLNSLAKTIGQDFDALNKKIDKVLPHECEQCKTHQINSPLIPVKNATGEIIEVCTLCAKTTFNRRNVQ